MATIQKEQDVWEDDEEQYKIVQKVTYKSTSEMLTIRNGTDEINISVTNWELLKDLVDEALKVKKG